MTNIKTSLILPEEMVAQLDEEAEASGISRAEVIRRAILAHQEGGDPDQADAASVSLLAERNRPAVPLSVCNRAILTTGAVLYLGLGVIAATIARALRSGGR